MKAIAPRLLVGCLSLLAITTTARAQAPQLFPVGSSPRSAVFADTNGDGALDVVNCNAESDSVSVLLGNGDGSLQPARFFPTGNYPTSLATADFDGDGVLDVVTSDWFGQSLSLLFGLGDGSFRSPVLLSTPSIIHSVTVADFDGDDVSDLVYVHPPRDLVSVRLGNGDGSFQDAVSYAVGDGPNYVVVADLDGDALPDLVVGSVGSQGFPRDIRVLLGHGDGTFQDAVSFPVYAGPMAAIDADGDAILDLAVTHTRDDYVSVLLSDGGAGFEIVGTFETGSFPRAIWAGHLDGDTVPDLLTADADSHAVSKLLGNGDGSFRSTAPFAAVGGRHPLSVAVADLDGNGLLDVVTANLQSDDLSVLRDLFDPTARPRIDIEPRSDRNRVQPMHRGLVEVAILGSSVFDVEQVDATSLAFGPAGAPPLRRTRTRDVNRDGFTDLVSVYSSRETGIAFGDTEACLSGTLLDARALTGCDAIDTTPRCGRGAELALLLAPVLWLRRLNHIRIPGAS